jgi:amidase
MARIGGAIPSVALARAKAAAAADAAVIGRVFAGGVDVVMTPMFTRRPLRVREYEGTSALRTLNGSIRFVPYCGAFNHTGQPAASVPAGAAPDGFPLAVQLVAPADGEPVLLSLSAQLERAIGWPDRRPPEGG